MPAVGSYVAGVLIALGTTCANGLGLALQKQTHQKLELPREHARRRSVGALTADGGAEAARNRAQLRALRSYRHTRWLAGVGLMTAAALTSLVVVALLGQAAASSFAAVTILWNALFAWSILGERLTPLDGLVSAILVTGCIIAVVHGGKGGAGSPSGGILTQAYVTDTWDRAVVFIAAAFFAAAMLVGGLVVHFALRRRSAHGVGTARGLSPRQLQATVFARLLLAGVWSAVVGSCAKGFVSQLSYAVKYRAPDVVASWFGTWLFALFLLTALVFQLRYLSSSLKDANATTVVPMYQACLVLFGVTFGLIFWGEARGKPAADIVGFLCGVGLILLGICLLLLKPPHVVGGGGVAGASLAAAISSLLASHAPHVLRRTVSAPALLALKLEDTTLSVVAVSRAAPGTALRGVTLVRQARGERTGEAASVRPASGDAVHAEWAPHVRQGSTSAFLREATLEHADVVLRVAWRAHARAHSEPARGARFRATIAAAGVAWVHARAAETPPVAAAKRLWWGTTGVAPPPRSPPRTEQHVSVPVGVSRQLSVEPALLAARVASAALGARGSGYPRTGVPQ
jgi:hypothetical protein